MSMGKKIKGLKVTEFALKILSGAATLVTSPIAVGIAFAAGLGSIVAGSYADNVKEQAALPVK